MSQNPKKKKKEATFIDDSGFSRSKMNLYNNIT